MHFGKSCKVSVINLTSHSSKHFKCIFESKPFAPSPPNSMGERNRERERERERERYEPEKLKQTVPLTHQVDNANERE